MSILQEIKEAFNQHLGTPPAVKPAHVDLFAKYTTPHAVIAIIDEIIGDKSKLQDIAARSYTHTLGFNKIIVLREDAEIDGQKSRAWEFRLHIWTPKSKSEFSGEYQEEIHAHSFDFLSRIITGKIQNECFAQTEEGDENYDFYEDGTPRQTFSHSVSLVPWQTVTAQAGDIYYHPHQVPHRVAQSLDDHNSTAVLVTNVVPPISGGSFRPANQDQEDVVYTYDMYSPQMLYDVLNAYKEKLKDVSPVTHYSFTEVLVP